MLTVVNPDGSTKDDSLLDEIVREGARRMLAAALEAEVNSYIAELAHEKDQTGRRLVVRNGYHQPRKVTTAAGERYTRDGRFTVDPAGVLVTASGHPVGGEGGAEIVIDR